MRDCQYRRLLYLMKTSCSDFSVLSLLLSGRNIFPALLKIHSAGAELKVKKVSKYRTFIERIT